MMTLQAQSARDVMTPGPYSLAASETPEKAAEFLISRGFGSAVVIDDAGHPIGVVTKSDLLIHQQATTEHPTPRMTTVRDVMTPAVFTVHLETPIASVVRQFLVLNIHHLFVADPGGTIVGIISPLDILRKLL
ncbi:MAG: CBS domain-containing protein [Bacteroidales bacterium]|nr:CBS domain-containing protein [Bacteroidales bacterium]